MKALPTASKPKVSAPAGRSPVDRRSKLPVATNPTAHSCEELLRDEKLSTNRSRARSRAAVKRGRLGLVHGQLRRAQREFCRAVASDPTNASAQKELAELLLFLKDGNAGLARVRTALEIDPENRDLQGLHGDALARLGRYVEARQAWLGEARLKDGSEANRRLVKRFLRTARGFRFAHAWAEAERLYRRVAVIEPSNTEASLGLAQALRGLGQSDEARQWFDYANKLSHGEEGAQVTQELEAVR
jgi:Tfp pilus assembly protein PilF